MISSVIICNTTAYGDKKKLTLTCQRVPSVLDSLQTMVAGINNTEDNARNQPIK